MLFKSVLGKFAQRQNDADVCDDIQLRWILRTVVDLVLVGLETSKVFSCPLGSDVSADICLLYLLQCRSVLKQFADSLDKHADIIANVFCKLKSSGTV